MRGRAFSWLDVKLGLRMMRRYPGVSLVIVCALAIGIPVSLAPNHLFTAVVDASPPFDQGKRVIGIVGLGQDGRTEIRIGDYERLRERLRTFGRVARRALVQIATGVTLGAGFWVVMLSFVLAGGEIARTVTGWPYMLTAAAAIVIAIGLAASLGPTLKYVRMRPVETLRVDG